MPNEAPPRDTSEARLRWMCRRGMKELDVMVTRYFEHCYRSAPESERRAFVKLVDEEDPDIWSWAMGYTSVPAEYQDVIAAFRVHR